LIRGLLRTPPRPLSGPVRPPLLPAAAYVVAMTALQMLRRPHDPPAWDSLFVEDGEIFLQGAISQGLVSSFTTAYQGYLHVVPRTIAEVAGQLPLERAPLVMALLATGLVSLLSVYVYCASAAWIGSRVLRGALAIAFVLLPAGLLDMNGVTSYVSWYMLYAAFWALASPWLTRGWIAVSSVLVLLTALSNPLLGFFLPVAIVMALRSGERRAWIVPGMASAGLFVQLLAREPPETFGETMPGEIPRIFADRVPTSLLTGERFLEDLLGGTSGSFFAWASLAVVAAAVGFGLVRLRGRRAWLLGGCALAAVVIFTTAALIRGTEQFLPDDPWLGFASRYVYPAVLFLLTGLLAAVDRAEAAPRLGTPREWAAAVALLAVIAVNLPVDHHAVRGPRWGPQLEAARERCDRPARERPREVVIPTAPYTPPGTERGPFTWELRVSCDAL
jgi:hypothetical protein